MGIASLTVAVLEATWRLSLLAVPAIYLAMLLYVPLRDDGTVVERLATSQRGLVLQYGQVLVAGLIGGGAVRVLVGGGIGTAAGAVVAAAAGVVAVVQEEPRPPRKMHLDTWRGWPALSWLAVPVLAAAALVTGDVVVRSAVALIFYSTIFWEL